MIGPARRRRSPGGRWLAAALVAAAPAAQPAAVGWLREDLGDHHWRSYTHAVAVVDDVFFLHDRHVEVRRADGSWEHWDSVLPAAVGPFSAAAAVYAPAIRIAVVVGGGAAGFRLDPADRRAETLPAWTLETGRGAWLAPALDGSLYFAAGGRSQHWGRLTDAGLEPLPEIVSVNPLGGYSAGLFALRDKVIVYGDHHVNQFDVASGAWHAKPDLFTQLGMRPRLDRGGMAAQDLVTGDVFMTQGRRSRAIGLLAVRGRCYYHLRPRLPVALADADRTLYVTHGSGGPRLNLLSLEHRALFSIDVRGLSALGVEDLAADVGSDVEVWNNRSTGSTGDLPRQRDSVCNVVWIDGWAYIQRKNILRRLQPGTLDASRPEVGYRFGGRFAQAGAALAYDGDRTLYLLNGFDDDLYAADVRTAAASGEPADVDALAVRRCAPIPAYRGTAPERDGRGSNTAMACWGGQLYALVDPVTRIVHRYDPAADRWTLETVVPGSLPYSDWNGADLIPRGDELLLLAGDRWARYHRDRGWSAAAPLPCRYDSDGGTAVLDAAAARLLIVVGGSSRDLAIVELDDGSGRLLRDRLPDPVSVHGRRAFVATHAGAPSLFLWRGHDSAECWRLPLDGLH